MAFTKIAAAGIGSTGTVTLENLVVTGIITASLTGTATTTTNIPNLTGAITSNNTTTSLGSFSSSDLRTALTDETGSGSAVFATSPTLSTVTVSSGGINVTGVSTLGNTVIGGGTTQLVVTGNARITGILTIGTSSITLDGSNNQLNVGTGVTLHHTNGVQVGGNTLHSTGLTLNSLTATGVSTFTNGPILVGTATSTGTASQKLQVSGGAYVSGNLGIGTTNPTSKLQVVGDTRVSGIITAFDFYNDAEYPSVRPTLDLAFAQTKILDSRITFTRASTATYVNASGLIASAAVNEARFDHDPVTGESLGFLVEESRTNIRTASILFDSGVNQALYGNWFFASIPSYTAAIAPDGTLTANRFRPTSPTATLMQRFSATAGVTYTISMYLKLDPESPSNNFIGYFGFMVAWSNNGSTLTGYAFPPGIGDQLTNEWKRFSFSYTLPAGATSMEMGPSNKDNGVGDPNYSVLAWGWQIEQGAFPTSYIPTTGSTVTRSADVASITGTNFSSWYNQSEGTVFGKVNNMLATGAKFAYIINNGTGDYRHGVNAALDAGEAFIDGSSSASTGTTPTILNGNGKFAHALKTGDNAYYINGTSIGTNSISIPTNLTQLAIGYRGTHSPDSQLCGTIKKLTYYPKRLSNAQLQTITI